MAGAGGLVLALLVVAGCGGAREGQVSGTVKVDGALVEEGAITFIPADGQGQTAGGPIKDGQYSVKVPTPGVMKVSITRSIFDREVPIYPGQKNSPMMRKMKNDLPAKYNEKTELTFEVKPGANPKDWDLPLK